MSNKKIDDEGPVGLAKYFVGLIFRVQLVGAIVGAAIATIGFFATDFWSFRSAHQELVRAQYVKLVELRREMEEKVLEVDRVFQGNSTDDFNEAFASKAINLIKQMESTTDLLPGTQDELGPYMDSITVLTKYTRVEGMPEKNSEEWIIEFGKFRKDYEKYLSLQEAYFKAVSDEVGSYARYVSNS